MRRVIKWEYQLLILGNNVVKNMEVMSTLGEEGWECVAVAEGVAYFKRPKDQIRISDSSNAIPSMVAD